MGGPKSKPLPPPGLFFCGMCEGKFSSKKEYAEHIANHPEPDNKAVCSTCKWNFEDTHMLEKHRIFTGHDFKHECSCGAEFANVSQLHKHRTFPSPCSDAFRKSPPTTNKLRLRVESPSTPHTGYGSLGAPVPDHSTPSPAPTSGVYCKACRQTFLSQARFVNHVLGCAAKAGEIGSVHSDNVQDETVGASLSADDLPPRPHSRAEAAEPLQSSSRPATTSSVSVPAPAAPSFIPTVTVTPATAEFLCNIKGCQKSFRSEPGLIAHKKDIHQIGGTGLNMRGKDSWMVSQSARQRLKEEGLLTVPHPHHNRRAVGRAPVTAFRDPVPSRMPAPTPRSPAPAYTPAPHAALQALAVPPHVSPSRAISQPIALALPPLGQSLSGVYELQQGDQVCKQIQHLRIAADIVVQNDGKFVVDELAWTRIGVARQLELASMLEKFAAISAKAQRTAHLPSPKAFTDENNNIDYPTEEFEHSPAWDPEHPALGVVAIVCSKILLADRCQEVVKVAAIDVLSCRVLLNHLVCTDPSARVKDWKTKSTGLKAFYDIEAARQDGYKVMMGWKAVRTALFKYIDKETMLVGQNLRADLDALRIIHGRAVDIAKSVEKAAKGPLSKQQLSLESLCRDFAGARLIPHPVYGHNVLQAAFGAREMVLWMLKNEDHFINKSKVKSLDYQRLG